MNGEILWQESINIAHVDLGRWKLARWNSRFCRAERNPLVAFRFPTTWCCPTQPPCQSGFECVSRRAMRTHGTLPPSSTCPFTSWIPPPSPRSSSQYLWRSELHCTLFWVFSLKTWTWGRKLRSQPKWYAKHVLKSVRPTKIAGLLGWGCWCRGNFQLSLPLLPTFQALYQAFGVRNFWFAWDLPGFSTKSHVPGIPSVNQGG